MNYKIYFVYILEKKFKIVQNEECSTISQLFIAMGGTGNGSRAKSGVCIFSWVKPDELGYSDDFLDTKPKYNDQWKEIMHKLNITEIGNFCSEKDNA